MVSRTGNVQVRNYLAVLLIIIGGLTVRSSSEDTSSVRDERQVENEWAFTSKRDHKGPNTYAFSYDVENAPTNNVQYRMEERHPNGSIVGSYGQVQPDGQIRVVSYVADKDGVKAYVKDNGADQYVAEGSSLDPIQRITSQIIQTAAKSQQQQQLHRSPLHDKYQRPTPSTAAAAEHRVDTAHAYHHQRTNVDPAAFRPDDSPGFRETEQPFVGDQLKDKLHASHADYHVQQTPRPLQTLPLYNVPVPTPTPQQPSAQHYVLNVPPLPALADNSPLPLLPGQQPLPITPDRGPVMIQLQQPQQQQHQYQPTQVRQQQSRLPSQQQQQFLGAGQAQQQYQQQPVRVQPPALLQQNVQYQPQQARVVAHQTLPPQQQHQQQLHQLQQQQLLQLQRQQQLQQQQLQQQQLQQQQLQQQQKLPYQQSVMQQPYTQQVNIPAHPSQLQLSGTVQQHRATAPMQFFHQPNPATTVEQYRQQLQLQAAESRLFPVFALPPGDSVFDFNGNRYRF